MRWFWDWHSLTLVLMKFGFSRSVKQSASWSIAATMMGQSTSSKLSGGNERRCRCARSIAAWPTKCGIWEMGTSCSKLCGDLWKLKFNGVCKWVVRSPQACIYITKGSLTKEKWEKEYNIQASGLNYSNFLFSLSLFAFYLDQSTTEEAVFSLTLTEGRQEARSERIVWWGLQILACCSQKKTKKTHKVCSLTVFPKAGVPAQLCDYLRKTRTRSR